MPTGPVGLASESNVAFAITEVITFDIATETDTAFSVQPERVYQIGQAVETDSALVITEVLALDQPVETDTALPTHVVNKPLSGTPKLPRVTLAGTMVLGNSYTGAPRLRSLRINAHFAWRVNTRIPGLRLVGIMANGADSITNVKIPRLRLTGSLSVPHTYDADRKLPVIKLTGTLVRGAVLNGTMQITLRRPKGTFVNDVLWDGELALPAPSSSGGLVVDVFADGTVLLPVAAATGMLTNPSDVSFEGWVLNPKILVQTKYSAYNYSAFGALGGSEYGVNANGIYRLDGADDDGANIDAVFLSGHDDLGVENLKVQHFVYTGYETDGDLELLIGIDDNDTFSYAYPVTRDRGSSKLRPARIDIGKGIKSRFWQIGMRNTLGADFTVSSMELGAISTRRKS